MRKMSYVDVKMQRVSSGEELTLFDFAVSIFSDAEVCVNGPEIRKRYYDSSFEASTSLPLAQYKDMCITKWDGGDVRFFIEGECFKGDFKGALNEVRVTYNMPRHIRDPHQIESPRRVRGDFYVDHLYKFEVESVTLDFSGVMYLK